MTILDQNKIASAPPHNDGEKCHCEEGEARRGNHVIARS